MDKLFSLIKTDLKNTYGFNSYIKSFKNKKNIWINIIMLIAFLSLLPSYYFMIKGVEIFYDAFFQIGQSPYLLQMGVFASQALILFLGILYVMSKYYFSSDLNQLIPLPIKPSYILGSKFITLIISEYLTTLPVILPFIIIYGVKGGEGILYWIYSVVLVLTLPIIPLFISSLLVMIFMKYTNIAGKKDLIRVIGAVLFMVFVIGLQLTIQRMAMNSVELGEEFIINLAMDSQFLVKKLGIVFPPSMWITLSLVNNQNIRGLLYLLLILGISIISITVIILLSETIFFDGLIGNNEVLATKGKKKLKDINKTMVVTKPYIALAKKEIIMLFKTPVYLLNGIGGVIIVPVILVISILTGEQSMEPLIGLIKQYPHILTLVSIGLIVTVGMINSIGSTTFSREGKNMWIQRILPIRPKDQVVGRILSALAIQLIGIVFLIIGLFFIKKLALKEVLIITILGLLGSIPMTQIGMAIDISRPMLIWDNPQRAMKQNLNVLISMGVGTLVLGGLFLIIKNLIFRIDMTYIYLLLAGIFIFFSILLYFILIKLIEKQFVDLDN